MSSSGWARSSGCRWRPSTVDVVISNCVLNLVPDKAQAFAEMFRVLRPGGRFCVSDIVATGELPPGVRDAAGLYVGCIAGAMPETEYLRSLEAAGFREVVIVKATPIELPDEASGPSHDQLPRSRRSGASGVALKSVTVLGTLPLEEHGPQRPLRACTWSCPRRDVPGPGRRSKRSGERPLRRCGAG